VTIFDAARFRELWQRHDLALGSPLTVLGTATSTNDLALEAARAGAAHGATFVADQQTEGRGRQGRRWFGAAGESLLFSCLTRPALRTSEATSLPLAAGLALREVLSRHVPPDVVVELKWPNDVLASRKKICGVLVETQLQGSQLAAAVIGVGLNLRTTSFPDELLGSATSIVALGGVAPEPEALLLEVLLELTRYLELVQKSGLPALAVELDRHDALKGRLVDIDGLKGRARGLDPCGRLIVVDELGVERRVVSGHVILLDG